MKKLYILLLVVGLAWLCKLSYDVFKISEQQNSLMQMTHQLEKADSKLNDQLIALQRVEAAQAQNTIISTEKLNDLPQNLIKQQLLLIEFSLKEQEPYYALEKLIELGDSIHSYPISPALQKSLELATLKDIDLIKQYIVKKDEQDQKIQKILRKLETELKKEMLTNKLVPSQTENQHFWQKWLSIDSVKEPATQLIQRPLIIKEAQLKLLMARQLLQDGQYAQYQLELNDVADLLKTLPDQNAKQIVEQLENLKSISVISQPILTTRALIG